MKKVLVAMSGGVDSSVAAALLKKQGYFVMGGYMKNFSTESWTGVIEPDCLWKDDVKDVQTVCQKLGIEFRAFNFEKEYSELVIDYFFEEYAAGRTPNPDVMCNKEIKFGLFLEKALELGFDYIATGHYARVRPLPASGHPPQAWGGIKGEVAYEFLKGIDPKKDQSYFLYNLTQEQLTHVLFPIGEYTKPQVRELARKFELPNAEKKDSQGLCFVGKIKLRAFLSQRIPEKVGETVTADGRVIGKHPGAAFFTIGQRHGLGIGGGVPYYVVAKNMVRNQVSVAERKSDSRLYTKTAFLRDIHWINRLILNTRPRVLSQLAISAKIRYQQENQRCLVTRTSGGYEVEFQEPQFAIASGQAVVFYDEDKVLGGGIVA